MKVPLWLKRLMAVRRSLAAESVPPGLYHAVREVAGHYARFHLRVERDGSGMLLANATAMARLTPTGVLIAKGLMDGEDEATILRALQRRFRGAPKAVMEADIANVEKLIETITAPRDLYPVFNLEDAALSPYEAQLIAPFQAVVPLGSAEQMVALVDRLWAVGIPHATFVAPAAPDGAALIRAVERAEDVGMIAGVRAMAQDLQQGTLLPDLLQAGVDYITLPYVSPEAAAHDALCGQGDHAAAHETFAWLEANEVCAVAELPLLTTTVPDLEATVEAVLNMGADNLVFVAYATVEPSEDDPAIGAAGMPQVAAIVEETAHEHRARFLWSPPVERDPALPLAEQVCRGPRAVGDVAVRVEPDGEVIPPRGPCRSAGNLLRDPWEAIWEAEAFRVYRERVEAPTRCDICPGLTICAADCPREPRGWSTG